MCMLQVSKEDLNPPELPDLYPQGCHTLWTIKLNSKLF